MCLDSPHHIPLLACSPMTVHQNQGTVKSPKTYYRKNISLIKKSGANKGAQGQERLSNNRKGGFREIISEVSGPIY